MSQHEYHTAYDPNAADMAPTLAEARRDEAAMRRRRGIPRDPQDGPADLIAALDRSVATAQRLYREARR